MRNRRFSSVVCDLLEPRRLLAGNVTATVVKGDLLIQGDADKNRIIVTGLGLGAGQVMIQPADDSTTINGEMFQAVLQGVTGSVRIALGAKADNVVVEHLNLPKGLTTDGGKHGDSILVRESKVAGALALSGGHGDDMLTVLNSIVTGATNVRGDGGHDLINLDLATFNGKVTANGNQGHDSFALNSTFNAGKAIDGDRGRDKVVTGVNVNTSFGGGNAQGWQAGFADYPVGEEEFYELESGIRDLPAELGSGKAYYLSGNNHSDDLFMFLKRKLGTAQGLKKNATYLARFDITFGSNVPTACGGIGGSPGESVYLKAGASATDPSYQVDGENHYRMTIDKGNQAQSGRDASNVGNISNGDNCDTAGPDPDYKSVRKTHVHTARVKTDSQGNLWVIVGTDSGFEGTTSLYIQSINVRLVPVS
jgi:hypothetical protein